MRIPHLKIFFTLAYLLLLTSLAILSPALAQAESSEPTEEAKTFPGLNEVVPQTTAVAARVAESEAQIQQAETLEDVYVTLDEQTESLKKLEESYKNWEEINNWQLNRLLGARSSYTDLSEQQKEPLGTIYNHLETLGSLRGDWEYEKNYWQEWKSYFRKNDIKAPSEAFTRTLASINELLKRITETAGMLVKGQQKYSPGQEIIASRLKLIENTLDSLRQDSFRRNTHALVNANYYKQFNRRMFTDFANDLATSVQLPDTFFKRYEVINALHIISIVIILMLLLYRKRQPKPLTEEWVFLYRRPLSGAIFITICVFVGLVGEFYGKAPPIWRFLVVVVITAAAIRLLNAIYLQGLVRKFIRIIAIIFIVNEALQVFGLPTPLLQLYQALLCAVAIPSCLLLLRNYRQEIQAQLVGVYIMCGVAILGFITAVLGFATLTTNLIDAALSTFILILLVQMALRMIKGGIHAFMALGWIKNRQFMKNLGIEETTHKLLILLRIVVLVNAVLYSLVVWKIFDNMLEARTYLLSFEYNIGEFSISIEMVFMVVVVLYLTSLISWVIQAFLDSQVMSPKNMDIGVKESLKRLVHYALFTIGFLAAISMAGLDLQKFTILAGAMGVGIGFGLQNVVNNFVGGLILLFERPVKVGDTINIDQDWGTITRIGLRSTVFETFDRSEIIVPNADLISQKVTNWTFTSKMVRVQLPIGVAYGSPLEKVLGVLNKAALEHSEVLSYPEPTTVFEGFGSSSIDFNLRFWVHSVDERMRIRTEVAVIVDRLFREAEITIPFPQQDLHLRSVEEELKPLFGKKSEQGKTGDKTEDEGTPL